MSSLLIHDRVRRAVHVDGMRMPAAARHKWRGGQQLHYHSQVTTFIILEGACQVSSRDDWRIKDRLAISGLNFKITS